MSKLYILKFDDNESVDSRWGLFYDDVKGEHHLTEDFKPLIFNTAAEAREKLSSMEAERRSEDSATAFTIDEAKAFAESQKWRFAKTYAKSAPHEYLIKKWLPAEERLLFERLVQTINTRSVVGYFYGHKNNYLILGDHYYWYMPFYPDNMAVDLINRTTTDYLEYRDGTYYYKLKNTVESTNEPNRM